MNINGRRTDTMTDHIPCRGTRPNGNIWSDNCHVNAYRRQPWLRSFVSRTLPETLSNPGTFRYISVMCLQMQMRPFLIFLILIVPGLSIGQSTLEGLVDSLKMEIARKDEYVNVRLGRIDKLRTDVLKSDARDLNEKFRLYNELHYEYRAFIYDSAFSITQNLIKISHALKDSSKIEYSRLKFAFLLMSSGLFKESLDTLRAIRRDHLPDTSRQDYYRVYFRSFMDLAIYDQDTYYAPIYESLSDSYLDTALYFSTRGSYQFYSLTAFKEAHAKRFGNAIATLLHVVENLPLTGHQRAMTYFELSNCYANSGDPARAGKYAAMSALNDIRSAVKETAASLSLTKILFESGDVENAFVLANEALSDAEFYGARQRKMQIISLLPTIAAKRFTEIEIQRKRWITISIAAVIIAALIVVFLWLLTKQLRRVRAAEIVARNANVALHETNQKLLEAERVKEKFIGYYVNNNAQFIHRIEAFKSAVERKIQMKKFDDISFLMGAIKPNNDRQEFYTNFDKVFLSLFPDFVERFNLLFPEKDRLSLKRPQTLSTELRIFALHRLGIHDAAKIAEILGYSVNTIYSYKNRIKSKSIVPNEEFDARIMQINSVDPMDYSDTPV